MIQKKFLLTFLIIILFLISGCVSQTLKRNLESKYDVEINSFREGSKSIRYSSEFRICQRGEQSNNCKPKNYRDFDNLEEKSSYSSKVLSKKPDMFFVESETNDKDNQIFAHTISLCINNKNELWDSRFPDFIFSETNYPCERFGSFGEAIILRIKSALQEVRPRVRQTQLDGRNVIEIYGKDKGSKFEEEAFIYLDAQELSPYKSIEKKVWEPYDLLINGEEVTHFELVKNTRETLTFGLNDVQDSEFFFPENIKNLRRCSYTTDDVNKAGELFRAELDRLTTLEVETQQKISEEDFNKLEELRISFPMSKCKGFKPRPYKDYLNSQSWNWYSDELNR